MFIITVIQNNELKACHLVETLKQARGYFKYYIRQEIKARPNTLNMKELMLKKEYKSDYQTINITYTPGPKVKQESRIFYQGKYYSPTEYLKKLNRPEKGIKRKAKSMNMTLYEYIHYRGWMPNQDKELISLLDRGKNLSWWSANRPDGPSRLLTTVDSPTQEQIQAHTLPPIVVPESDLVDKWIPYEDYEPVF